MGLKEFKYAVKYSDTNTRAARNTCRATSARVAHYKAVWRSAVSISVSPSSLSEFVSGRVEYIGLLALRGERRPVSSTVNIVT